MKLFVFSLIIAATTAATIEKVNLNTANAADLDKIYGVGEQTAKKIILHRESVGPFTQTEDLKLISGIGTNKYQTIIARGTAGTNALPIVVACPMTCEVKVTHHPETLNNNTSILKITHQSNPSSASSAHGPAIKHPKCRGSKLHHCAPAQRLLHKCYKLSDGTSCACACSVCNDAHGKAPCHPNQICGDDISGNPLVFDSATGKCVKCGRWNNDRPCKDNMCLSTDVNNANKQLVYDPATNKCARCGHGANLIACANNVCEDVDSNTGNKIHYAGLGKCEHCGEKDNAPACGGTTCAVLDRVTGRKLAFDSDTLACKRCGHQNGAIPCPLNGNPTCETEDTNDVTKKLVYDPESGKCKRCGHGHNMHACTAPNTVCEATDINTGHKIAFNTETGKCHNCGAKHNQPACTHADHATKCEATDSVTGFKLAFDAVTGKCVRCGYRDNTVPCIGTSGEKECALVDADDANKMLVYKSSTNRCMRCGHGHNLLPCDRTNPKCAVRDAITNKKLEFDSFSGKCVCKLGDQHNTVPCDTSAPYECGNHKNAQGIEFRMTYRPDEPSSTWHGKCKKCGAKHTQLVCSSGAKCDTLSDVGKRLVAGRDNKGEEKCYHCGQKGQRGCTSSPACDQFDAVSGAELALNTWSGHNNEGKCMKCGNLHQPPCNGASPCLSADLEVRTSTSGYEKCFQIQS